MAEKSGHPGVFTHEATGEQVYNVEAVDSRIAKVESTFNGEFFIGTGGSDGQLGCLYFRFPKAV